MRRRLTGIVARRREQLGIDPPVATEDVAAMITAMADGFLLDRTIDPELRPELYAQMIAVFLTGLATLAGPPRAAGGAQRLGGGNGRDSGKRSSPSSGTGSQGAA